MSEFEKPIGRAWRRLRLQRFVSALVWTLLACLLAATAAVAVDRFAGVELPGPWWAPLAISAGVAVVLSALIALLTGPTREDAAVAIDHAFGLNERLSTALTLPESLRESPAGRALMHDAIRHVQGLDIGSQFGLKRPKLAWVPIVPAILAVGLALLPENFIPHAGATSTARTPEEQALQKKAVAKSLQAIKKKIAENRKDLKTLENTETGKLMAEIQQTVDRMAKLPPADKEKAFTELNKMADALKERRKELGSNEDIERQLEQLEDLGTSGPADEFAKELAKGDFAKAAEALKDLQQKLAENKLTEKEKKELRQQLSALKNQLNKMANQEERKKQIEQARAKGQISEQEYKKQMEKLEQQAQDMKALTKLASKLGQCEQAMANGDMKKAAQQLGMGEQELQQMAQSIQEMESLDSALADLQQAKDGMAGDGMNQLGEQLEGLNRFGQGMGDRPGQGMNGRGRGQGDRAEAPDDTAGYESRVKQQITRGKAIMGGFADPSKQVRGESVLELQGNVEAAAGAAAEALTDQKIPSDDKKHVLDYFDRIRKGGGVTARP